MEEELEHLEASNFGLAELSPLLDEDIACHTILEMNVHETWRHYVMHAMKTNRHWKFLLLSWVM